ncbi:MAG: peptidoglycan-associated lipoprotein Pal [Proteobacteria bacterium]|nr:peptidoglycan-associated lipoprotein Pal [Pseudomonadota bacterium]MCP4921856.1 peptidoglycan-associated lipoprotein Pal [Pseudomonadota bacterium]
MIRISTILMLSLTLAATCKRNKGDVEALPDDTVTDANADGTNGDGSDADANAVPEHVQTMVDNFNKVYFDFDAAELSPESRAALDANVALLQKHTGIKVQIQGHADERGATEYNLALGDRRANAVKDYMATAGVGPSRLTVISYGEEAPLADASNERAWSQNRRAEFVVTWGADGAVKSSTD